MYNEMKFIKIKAKHNFFSNEFIDHRDAITEMKNRGYKYVGYIPVKLIGYGAIDEIDLIFEKEEY